MADKKSKRIAFTFDERSLTTLENMTQEGHFSSFSEGPAARYTEVTVTHPVTGRKWVIKIPSLSPLVRGNDEVA